MPKQTGLKSTGRKQRKEYYGNGKQIPREEIDNPWFETLMTTLAVIQQFHPNDDKSSEESNDEEEEQIDQKTCLNQHQSMEKNHRRQTRTAYLSIDKWKFSRNLIPNYSKFPDHLFKHLLCKAIPRYRHQINQYLADPKLLSFIQQHAHLMCIIFQLEMEKDYWKHAMNGLLSAVNWLSRMSKDLTKRYSINWDYPRTENNIRHRQRTTENKLDQANREAYLHLQQQSSCWPIPDKMSIHHQIMTKISEALIVLIKNGLQKLHTSFEEKKILMQFDAYDVCLLKLFYDLNPTEEQKLNVEKIWRAKRKFCQRTIHEIKTNALDKAQATVQDDTSSMFKGNYRLYIDYDYQQDQVNFLESLSTEMRTIIETRQKNIERRTQQIRVFKNTSSIQ